MAIIRRSEGMRQQAYIDAMGLKPKKNEILILKGGEYRKIECRNRIEKLVLRFINMITPGVTVFTKGSINRKVTSSINDTTNDMKKLKEMFDKKLPDLQRDKNVREIVNKLAENATQIKMIKTWNDLQKQKDKSNKNVDDFFKLLEEICVYVDESHALFSEMINEQSPVDNETRGIEALRFLPIYENLQSWKNTIKQIQAFDSIRSEGRNSETINNNFISLEQKAEEMYKDIEKLIPNKINNLENLKSEIKIEIKSAKAIHKEADESSKNAATKFASKFDEEDTKKHLKKEIIDNFGGGNFPLLLSLVEASTGEDEQRRKLEFSSQETMQEVQSVHEQLQQIKANYDQVKSKLARKTEKLPAIQEEEKQKRAEYSQCVSTLKKILPEIGFENEYEAAVTDILTGEIISHGKQGVIADPLSVTQDMVQDRLEGLIKESSSASVEKRKIIQANMGKLINEQDTINDLIVQRDKLEADLKKIDKRKGKIENLRTQVEINLKEAEGLDEFDRLVKTLLDLSALANDAKEKANSELSLKLDLDQVAQKYQTVSQELHIWNNVEAYFKKRQ